MRRPDTPCSVCGRLLYTGSGSASQPTCRECRKARRLSQGFGPCELCGKPRAKNAGRFCSRECSGIAYSLTNRIEANCATCGQLFVKNKDRFRYCSRKCSHIGQAQPRIWNWRCLLEWRGCLECGGQFCMDARRKKRFCTPTCGSRWNGREQYRRNPERFVAAAHKRRAILLEASVEIVEPGRVFERDKWTCHICKGKVRRSARRKRDPEMASLDHLVPLSLGGEHSYANVACSHLRCNLKKHTRAVGEQLALI